MVTHGLWSLDPETILLPLLTVPSYYDTVVLRLGCQSNGGIFGMLSSCWLAENHLELY